MAASFEDCEDPQRRNQNEMVCFTADLLFASQHCCSHLINHCSHVVSLCKISSEAAEVQLGPGEGQELEQVVQEQVTSSHSVQHCHKFSMYIHRSGRT